MRLQQIVSNLLSNAVKYTPAGGSIHVSVTREGGDAVLRVRDTGIGISREDQAKLFDAFSQLESSGSGRQEGTGLGLHLSQKLAQLLGAKITLTSEPGRGSAFTLSIERNQP